MTALSFASPEPHTRRSAFGLARRLRKAGAMTLGFVVIAFGLLIGPLPGPGGIPVVTLGLILVLRASYGAKRLFIRAWHRWPRTLSPIRRLLRRNSPFVSIFWQMMLRAERFITHGHGVMAGWRRSLKRRWAA